MNGVVVIKEIGINDDGSLNYKGIVEPIVIIKSDSPEAFTHRLESFDLEEGFEFDWKKEFGIDYMGGGSSL